MERRKPTHPGQILEEDYIKPLQLSLQILADRLGISRNMFFRIRSCDYSITPAIAISLAEAFDTTPQLWLNLQQAHDLLAVSNEHRHIDPIVKNGWFL